MAVASVGTALISIELEIGTMITAQGSLITIITEFHISILEVLNMHVL
jgi:hypothetical protein